MSERTALVALCTSLALPTVGLLPALRKRAADALLTKAMLEFESSPTTSEPATKKPRRNPWLAFVKEEKPRLIAAGWKKGTILTELRRLWHAGKDKSSEGEATPLLLTYVSDSADTEDEDE